MRRILIAGFAALLAVALIAPAAQAKTQIRFFQDLSASSHSQVFITVHFKDRHGNKKFTPRRVGYYHFGAPTSCSVAPVPSPGLDFSQETSIKLTKGKFYYDLANSAAPYQSITGYLRGKVVKTPKRFRVEGSLDVQDFDSTSSMNCATLGAITYAATPCRNPNVDSSLPPCYGNY